MLGGTTGALFAALGDTKRHFFISLINTSISILALLLGIFKRNIIVISQYISFALIINFFITYISMLKHTMKKSFFSFIKSFFPDLSIMVILFSTIIMENKFIYIESLFLSLLIKGVILGLSYIIGLIMFKQLKYFGPILPAKIKNKLKI